jgi:ethanolamine utilization protein EutA
MASNDLFASEHIDLNSVGIDIGSSTSHLVFSRLELLRMGAALSSRYVVVKREAFYESGILLTPYLDRARIDTETLGRFIAREYRAAGVDREAIDTGALILTGEAVKKENARAIADLFAAEAGRFVAVSAGDTLEAVMAAHGSGAAALSRREGATVMCVDVGGGTSKVAVVQKGEIVDTAAISVGARLVAVDPRGVVTRLEEVGYRVGREVGLDLRLGHRVAPLPSATNSPSLATVARYLAERLFELIRLQRLSPAAQALMRTPGLSYRGKLDAILFSGGVSEYIYGKETADMGDMGLDLGREIRARAEGLGVPLREPTQRIRATVIGASQYTIQVSGNTIYLSDEAALPVRNLQVLAPRIALGEAIDPRAVQDGIAGAFRRFDLTEGERPVALALRWEGAPVFRRIESFSRGLAAGLRQSLAAGMPMVLVFDGDVGGMVGAHLAEAMGIRSPVISIDGVDLREFDYIDIGEVIRPAGAVPVVIKSLVFPTLSEWYHGQTD